MGKTLTRSCHASQLPPLEDIPNHTLHGHQRGSLGKSFHLTADRRALASGHPRRGQAIHSSRWLFGTEGHSKDLHDRGPHGVATGQTAAWWALIRGWAPSGSTSYTPQQPHGFVDQERPTIIIPPLQTPAQSGCREGAPLFATWAPGGVQAGSARDLQGAPLASPADSGTTTTKLAQGTGPGHTSQTTMRPLPCLNRRATHSLPDQGGRVQP